MKKKKKIIIIISSITIITAIVILTIQPQNINNKHYCSYCGEGRNCIGVVDPVCGSDNTTYSNSCIACCTNKKLKRYIDGECGENLHTSLIKQIINKFKNQGL